MKRSNSSSPGSNSEEKLKVSKKEQCPHAEKCYRRNPHHFREYDHPHLSPFVHSKDSPNFPPSFIQDATVYLEQLKILRDLSNVRNSNLSESTNMGDSSKNKVSTLTKNTKEEAKNSNYFMSNANEGKREKTPQRNTWSIFNTKNTVLSETRSSKRRLDANSSGSANNTVKRSEEIGYRSIKKVGKTMKEKLEICSPYNIFYTKVPEAYKTLDGYNCISFPDLICPSLGELETSLQINFMIDVSWLMEQYEVHNLHKTPVTILYGYDFPMMKEYIAKKLPNVTPYEVKMKDPFGVHHSKIGIYKYTNESLRIVISTANLYYEDWNHYNQGLWLSPELPKMDESKADYECAGPTGFKTDLLFYLNSYNLPILKDWIALIKRADFTCIKVFFVCSTPGRHYPKSNGAHVHKVGDLLSKHCVLPAKTTPDSEGALSWGVMAQSSSLGSFGKTAGDWLRSTLLRSLASHKSGPLPNTSNATLSLIYPTVGNVLNSHFGPQGGGCLPYSKNVNEKQQWLKEYLHVWKADETGRTRAMPHIKSYCRVSPCLTKLAWYLLTSANISKSAWGGNLTRDGSCNIRSYEAGVMFLPHMFDEEYFHVKRSVGDDGDIFPFMYDLPLEHYKASDQPWCN